MSALPQLVHNLDTDSLKPKDAAKVLRALLEFAGKPEGTGQVVVRFNHGGVSGVSVTREIQ